MTVEAATHISDLDPSTIGNATDPTEGGAQISMVKQVLLTDLANINAAVTSSAAQLNYVDITTLGTAEASKAITVSAGGAVIATAVTWTDLGTVTTADINGGTIDGASVGASSASTGAFTTLTASGAVTFTSGTINGIVIGGSTPAAATVTALTANTSLVLNGSTAMTSVDTDLSSVSASHDTMTTAKAVKDYVDGVARYYTLSAIIADVSTAETVWIPIPVAGTVVRLDTVLEGAISAADATVTLTTSADAAMASVVITQSGSAAGDVDSDDTITNAAVTAGTALKLNTDGGSTSSQRLWATITVQY